jgi:hypothetical protein
VEKALLVNPVFQSNQFLIHDRDLPGRSAEIDKIALRPEMNRFTEGHGIGQVNIRLCSPYML